MTVMEGKIAVIDVNNKTTTQKYSGAVTGTSKLWLDNNFTTGIVMEIKSLVDDKSKFADWSNRTDIKAQLESDLAVLLYRHGYPPEWDEEVFNKIMEQTENFKMYADISLT